MKKKALGLVAALFITFIMVPMPAVKADQDVECTWDYTKAFECLEIVNAERAKQGVGPLKMDWEFMNIAMLRATETTVLYDHTRPNGKSCFSLHYLLNGENIAAGSDTAEGIMNQWMNSPGHRANILRSSFNSIGIGCIKYNGKYRYYWAQVFSNAPAQNPVNKVSNDLLDVVVTVSTDPNSTSTNINALRSYDYEDVKEEEKSNTISFNIDKDGNVTNLDNDSNIEVTVNKKDENKKQDTSTPSNETPSTDDTSKTNVSKNIADIIAKKMASIPNTGKEAYRLVNKSGKYFYTDNTKEIEALLLNGWEYEKVSWNYAKNSDKPIYRLLNKASGEHFFTDSQRERDTLKNGGWVYEGIAFYSDANKSVPVYRLIKGGNRLFTSSESEKNQAQKSGWTYEGICWYGIN